MNHYKQFEQRLAQLVKLNSISSTNAKFDQSNLAVVNTLATWLSELGFKCEIQAVPNYPGKANLIASLGSGPGGLVLAGHTDTVPCEAQLWQQDPFVLHNRDERFYGLGATDMKGFFPVILQALEQLHPEQLKEPIYVLATADEESSMCGARALVDAQSIQARCAIIGEPTNLRPIRLHKGIMFESVRVEGHSGHSSNPALGRNALDAMTAVMNELMTLRSELQEKYHNPYFEVPTPTLNLGCIHGGDNPNRICGSCELQFDLRLLPGMEIPELRRLIQTRLQPIAEKSQTNIVFQSLFSGVAPFEEPASSPFVQLAEKLSGSSSEAVAFATEAPFLQALGMQTIVMGPGSIDQAHQPNEFIAHEQIRPAIDLVKALIRKVCL